MALVKNGLPDGYTAQDVMILEINGEPTYINSEGVPIDQVGRIPVSHEEFESQTAQLNTVSDELAAARDEIARLMAANSAPPATKDN